jgi:hypothetical protein
LSEVLLLVLLVLFGRASPLIESESSCLESYYHFAFKQPRNGMYISNSLLLDFSIERRRRRTTSTSGEAMDLLDNQLSPYWLAIKVNGKYRLGGRDDQPQRQTTTTKSTTSKPIDELSDTVWQRHTMFDPLVHSGRGVLLALGLDYAEDIRPVNTVEVFIRLDEPRCVNASSTTESFFSLATRRDDQVGGGGGVRSHFHRQSFKLYNLQGDDRIEAFLSMLAGHRQVTLLAGFHACNAAYFVNLASAHYEAFFVENSTLRTRSVFATESLCPPSITLTDDSASFDTIGLNVERFGMWTSSPWEMFQTLRVVHLSLVYVDMMMWYWCTSMYDGSSCEILSSLQAVLSESDHRKLEAIVDELDRYLFHVVQISRKSVSVFISDAWRHRIEEIERKSPLSLSNRPWTLRFEGDHPLHNDLCVFKRISFGDSRYWVEDTQIWLLETSQWMKQQHCFMLTPESPQLTVSKGEMEESASPRFSRVIRTALQPGRPYFLVDNVCVALDNSNVSYNTMTLTGKQQMIFFNDNNVTSDNGKDNVVFDMNQLLQEDSGFLYSGLQIKELSVKGIGWETLQQIQQQATWVHGVTAWAMSVSPDHLCHDTEILVQVVILAKQYHDCRQDAIVPIEQCRFYSSHFHDLIGTIDRVVMAKSLSYPVTDWIRRMLAMFLDYFESRTGRRSVSGNNDNKQKYRTQSHSIRLMNRDDIFAHHSSICFDRVAFLGRNNGHITYFTSESVGNDFKCHMYELLQLPILDDQRLLDWTKICPMNAQNLRLIHLNNSPTADSRHRKVKITMTVRSGQRRQYLNVVSLQEMIINGLSTDIQDVPVDVEWFQQHIIHAGRLSLQEQAEIFSETDIFIAGHGAEVMNGLFMRAGSVVVDVFVGAYYEHYLDPMLREIGVKTLPLTIRNHVNQTESCEPYPAKCVHGSVLDGNALDCLGVRNCNAWLDLHDLRLLLQQAYLHVLSAKFMFPADKL